MSTFSDFSSSTDISNGRIPSMKSASCNTSSKNSSVSAIFSRFKLASSLVESTISLTGLSNIDGQ